MIEIHLMDEAEIEQVFTARRDALKSVLDNDLAKMLGAKTVVIDTENRSSERYADQFSFDILPLDPPFSPARYTEAIKFCEMQGYDTIIIDSLSHAWAGSGGALEMVDTIKSRSKSGNGYTAWRDVTPAHNALIEAMIRCQSHILGCIRAKTDYIQEKDDNGKTTIRKVGMAPIQREGMDYEFDIVFDIDWEHRAIVSKTRFTGITDKVFRPLDESAGAAIRDWLSSGAPADPEARAAETPVESKPVAPNTTQPAQELVAPRTQAEFVKWAKTNYNVVAKEVGPALVKAGIKAFDDAQWDAMQKAVRSHALDRDMAAGVAGAPGNGKADPVPA